MSSKAFGQTIDFIRDLDQARTSDEVCSLLLKTMGRFGAEHILAGMIPSPGSNRQQQLSNVILDYWPAGWTQRYFAHGYISKDPAIHGVRTSSAAFFWSDLEPAYRDSPSAWRIMNEASDFKLRQGFTIPVTTLEGDVAGFSIAGERLEVSPQERGMIALLATYALGRSILLRQAEAKPRITLSTREREALQWAAEGKSEWEIGEIIGISEHGVDKHMRSARVKLGTTSRTHAVAEAIRQGLIK